MSDLERPSGEGRGREETVGGAAPAGPDYCKLLSAVMDAALDAMVVIDDGGIVRYWNPAATEMFGHGADEAVGAFLGDLVIPEHYKSQFHHGFKGFRISGGGPMIGQIVELRAQRKDGTEFPIEHSIAPLEVDGKRWAVGVIRDMSRRARLTRRLEESRQQFRAIADYTHGWESWIGTGGNLLWVNPAVERVTGHPTADCHAMKDYPLSMVHPGDRAMIAGHLRDALDQGLDNDVRFRLLCKNGSEKWCSLYYQPIHDEDDGFLGTRWSVHNVTERVSAEARLKRNLEFQRAYGTMLKLGLSAEPLEVILEDALELVLSVPDLTVGSRGSVFLADPGREVLELAVQKGLGAGVLDLCATVPYGRCLCGKAAKEERVVFCDSVDEDHHTRPEGMKPHGHYCVPINAPGRLIGVLNVYVREGQAWSGDDEAFLVAMADGLAGIIERKQAEAALKRREAELRAVIDTALDCIVSMDEEGRITEFNPAAEKTFGYRRAEVLGRDLAEVIVPPDLRERHHAGLARLKRTGEARVLGHRLEITGMRADGSEFPVELAIDRLPVGGKTVFTGYLRDITERKQAEARIKEERDFARAIVDGLPGVFFMISGEGEFLLWNRNLEVVSGLDHDAVANAVPVNLFAAEDRSTVVAWIAGLLGGGGESSEVTEARLFQSDGGLKPYLLTGTRLGVGARRGMVCLGLDIGERKELEASLTRSNQDLEQFAYAASHDLQEPLRMVISYLQLLDKRLSGKIGGEEREFIDYAVDGSKRMSMLIKDLLAFSRVGTRDLDPVSVSLGDCAAQALDNLRVGIDESGAEIVVGDLPTLIADRGQMVRLFQNLIGNAVKYRAPDRAPRITLAARRHGGHWEITVEDNGIGIAPEHAERVFGVFQRLHGRTEYEGTGIGLAICKRIVERHGGTIGLTSEPGAGTCFVVRFGV